MGLAAPQVGVNVRLMVYNPTGRRGDKEYILVNPSIVTASTKRSVEQEGCLSFPRIFADVEVWCIRRANLQRCCPSCVLGWVHFQACMGSQDAEGCCVGMRSGG